MRVTLGQINAVVGDLGGNAEKMRKAYSAALEENVDLLIFPELAICGYPPEDLLHKKHFLEDNLLTVKKLAADCPQMTIITGFAEEHKGACYNSAAILQGGNISGVYKKCQLPNFGVFDERRYFKTGKEPLVITLEGVRIAVTICRDIWDIDWLGNTLKREGQIELIVNISASPFYTGKFELRQQTVIECADKLKCCVAYCNMVGGQDELVFDGRSILADASGNITAKANAFEEDLLIADIFKDKDGKTCINPISPLRNQPGDMIDEIYQALILGTRDYAKKNGFKKVLLGLSGGIDSSVVASIAAAAMGAENVTGITMPSKFNSPETISDAGKVAENLGIEFLTLPIELVLEEFNKTLGNVTGWDNQGIAFENLQARIRGDYLMSLSNQFGALVLTSGNKSETAVGYATLYGDTAGGFAVIKDVPKTIVYKLAKHINKIQGHEVIPADVINRAPSAELRADQKDSDSLPDYDLLDKILKGYVEEDKSVKQLTDSGIDADIVRKVIRMVDLNEYKRRQSPPGVKISQKAFGKDRRLPITNRYNHV